MTEDISTDTFYEGSQICRKCGKLMSPLEVMYMDGNTCTECRNLRFKAHIKSGMGDTYTRD